MHYNHVPNINEQDLLLYIPRYIGTILVYTYIKLAEILSR